jgi:outer membrane protein assembly complex protein YaeT
MRRKITKRLVIIGGGSILLITLVLSFFHLPFVKLKILSSIQRNLETGQGIHLTAETFDYNLLNLTFFFKGVRLEKAGKHDFPPIFQADFVRIRIPFSLLLRRRIRLHDVEILNPEIYINIDRNGENNLPFQSRPAEVPQDQAKLPEFIIQRAMVENGRVHFFDERQILDIWLSGIWVRGDWQGAGKHAFYLETRLPGSVSYGYKSFPLEKCVLQAAIDMAGIDVEEFLLTLAGSDFTFSGRANDLSSLVIDGTSKGRVDLDVIRTIIGSSGILFSGKVDFQSEFSGPLKDLSARIQLKGKDLAYGKWANIDLNSEISWHNRELEILSIDLKEGMGKIRAEGILHPIDWDKGNHLNLEWKNLDVSPVSDALGSRFLFSSVSSGTLGVSWSGFSLADVAGECEIHLGGNDGKNDSKGRAEITGKILARADSNGFHTTFQDISILGAKWQSEFLLSSDEISGNFELETPSIARIIPVILAFSKGLDKGIIQRLGLDGPISVSGLLGGSLEEPNVKFDMESDSLEILGTREIGIKGNIFYDSQSIGIESLWVHAGAGKFKITGTYPLRSSERTMRFKAEGENLALERIFGIFGVQNAATGTVAVSATVEGKIGSPEIRAKGSLHQVFIGIRDLGDLAFEIQTRKDEVAFHVESPVFSSSVDGSISLGHPRLLRLEWDTNRMRLDVFKEKMLLLKEHDISGLLTSQISMVLDLDEPGKKLDANARIEQFQLRTGPHLIQNKGPILVSFREEAFHIESLMLTGTGTEIEAKGILTLKDPAQSRLWVSADVDLSLLGGFFPNVDSSGFLRIESTLLGSLTDLDIAATLDLSEARFHYASIPMVLEDVQSHIMIKDNLIRIGSFSSRIGDSQILVKGEIPLESLPLSMPESLRAHGDREATVLFRFQDFDPAVLEPLYFQESVQALSGKISGGLELKGKQLQLDKISGKAHFETFELNVLGIPLKQSDLSAVRLENGVLLVQNLVFKEGENYFELKGKVSLTGSKEMDLLFVVELDLGWLSSFDKDGLFSGKARFEVHATESYSNPWIQGFVDIQDARFQRVNPRLFLEQLNGKIKFEQNRIEIEELRGVLNGGEIVLTGKAGFTAMVFHDIELDLKTENAIFDFPIGLRSLVSSELRLFSEEKGNLLSGEVKFMDARYTDDFNVGSTLFRLMRRDPLRDVLKEPNPFLKDLSFNLKLFSAEDLIIDNNISKSYVSADLVLTGTVYHPSLAGRMNILEGGEVYFSQNTFAIEQGTVDFVNPTRIEPELNLSARTQVQEYDIRLVLQGTPDKFSASLVSDPPLSEPNIVSLLVTGRTLESASASILSVAGSTALSYINSALTGKIEQATARALGLESVRIDAGLVSTEENPEARITVGQHISRRFELVYSQDLKDTRNQTWLANYNPFQSFNIQGVKRDDNEYNLAFRHEILFGAKRASSHLPKDELEKKELVMGDVELAGDPGLPAGEIYQKLKWKRGKRVNFTMLQNALERVRRTYPKNDYLSFSLTSRKEPKNGRLDLMVRIDSGPKVIIAYRGAVLSKKLKRDILESWIGSSFGQLAKEDIAQKIRIHLLERRYYQADVRSLEERGTNGERIIVFQISRGLRFQSPIIHYKGNRLISAKDISAYIRQNRLVSLAFYKPMDLRKHIEGFYSLHGFLRPKVQLLAARFEPEKRKVLLDFSIQEGVPFRVKTIEVEGAQIFEAARIFAEIGIHSGDIISPERFNQVDAIIEGLYLQKGFNDTRVRSDVVVDSEKGTVDLRITVKEGLGWVVDEIQILGNLLTKKRVIRRELKLKEGEGIHYLSINESRKRLYDLGVFERVNIDVFPLDHIGSVSFDDGENQTDFTKPCRVLVDVKEFKPYRLRYGLQYDTDTSFGVLGNLVDRNFLGNAFLLGSSFRLNRDERDARAFFRSPYFFAKKINTEFYLFFNKNIKPAFTIDRTGFTLQQQLKMNESSMISYNYSFEKIDTVAPDKIGEQDLDKTERIGTFNLAFSHDTRDDILNATRGIFLSQSVRYAPGFLGSKTRFISYFGQFISYAKVTDFLTYASSFRIGLGKGYAEDLPLSERFFAGGGTTIRGFKKDGVGPRDPFTDLPLGGEAVFVLNQELRFPIFKKFGGVVFLDLGNVYPKISDFDLLDIRKTAGFGFRLHTPFVLIRLDWGFKLDRHPGETLSQIFLSIGQAF